MGEGEGEDDDDDDDETAFCTTASFFRSKF